MQRSLVTTFTYEAAVDADTLFGAVTSRACPFEAFGAGKVDKVQLRSEHGEHVLLFARDSLSVHMVSG